MKTTHTCRLPEQDRARGFSLVELMVTLTVFAVVAGAITLVFISSSHNKQRTAHLLEAQQGARAAMDLMVRDIRTAGYGADMDNATPQPAITYIDSAEIILSENQLPFPANPNGPTAPLAYNPASTPKPRSLDGTAWAPPVRYATGAELIRYTLDVNNDGAINSSDVSAPQGADAAATPNPNDYVLVREVYGDSTGLTAGNNGGSQERIALVHKPGAGVPALFTVYMRGSSTPYNWANGPVPVAQLQDIQRIELDVTAAASRPNDKGVYARTTLHSEVNSMRSVPDFGATTYVISGYVYEDVNMDRTKGGSEPPLSGATVRLGSQTAYTSSMGYYQFRAPAGTYTLSHAAPAGYGGFTTGSYNFTITTAGATYSFGDTARSGGNVSILVYDDINNNGAHDTGENGLPGIRCTMAPGSPGATTGVTNQSGSLTLFTSTGGYAVTCNAPDTMTVTTTNPLPGTMTNHGTTSASFGLYHATTNTVSGKVFLDANRNGTWDVTESGITNVWVGVSKDAGSTVAGYALSNSTGDYTIRVPVNDPPRTEAYSVYCVPPGGYFPTSAQAINGVWVAITPPLLSKNFGMANYQVITLTASRVLSLLTGDMIEADWNGSQTQNARKDQDLILGADAGGTDNVSVWFNQYASSPLFTTTPDQARGSGYTRMALNSVMSMALDTLDRSAPVARPDLVTGTKYTATGNFFVWFNQNSNNNEGYLPAAYSTGQSYRTRDNGDVQCVTTGDIAGGTSPDIIVGTKGATAGTGSIEVWQSNDATTPTFTRVDSITTAGSFVLGEVTGMVRSDMDGDGDKDLIVATRTSNYNGQVVVFEFVSKANGSRLVQRSMWSSTGDAFTSVTSFDADGDGDNDIVVGSQRTTNSGNLYQVQNRGGFDLRYNYRQVAAPGIPLSLTATDLGANASRSDLAMGYRTTAAGFGGGVRVYYMDLGLLPASGVDPSNATVVNMVPALASANFNYGLNTTAPPSPYLNDLAAGVKITSTTGALVVFVR